MAKQDSNSSNGKGSSKFTTTEEQNAKRRAVKARQKHRSTGVGQAPVPLTEAIRQDRRDQREARREAMEAQRQQDVFTDLAAHAGRAKAHEAVTRLRSGSLARRLADEALAFFPLVMKRPTAGRSEVAFEQALMILTPEELERTAAIDVARRAVRVALGATFGKKSSQPTQAELVSA